MSERFGAVRRVVDAVRPTVLRVTIGPVLHAPNRRRRIPFIHEGATPLLIGENEIKIYREKNDTREVAGPWFVRIPMPNAFTKRARARLCR